MTSLFDYIRGLRDYQELRETLEIAIRSGRRCAHDLDHAADDSSRPEMYRGRADHYLSIFYSAKDMKNYRIKIVEENWKLKDEVERLIKLCKDNKLDPESDFDWPI